MTDLEITLSVLRDIRESIGALDERLTFRMERFENSLSGLDSHLSERMDRLECRMGAVETTLADLASQMLFLGRYVKNKLEPKSG
jgi:hypothetical protein